MAEKHKLGVRRLRKSINFGRLATEDEVQGDPADKGVVTYLALHQPTAPLVEADYRRRSG